MTTWLRIVGVILSAVGAVLLAWRVKGILEVLVTAQSANDGNFRLLIERLNSGKQDLPLMMGMDEVVERQQRRGIWLLVLGFGLIAIGNALNAVALYLGDAGV